MTRPSDDPADDAPAGEELDFDLPEPDTADPFADEEPDADPFGLGDFDAADEEDAADAPAPPAEWEDDPAAGDPAAGDAAAGDAAAEGVGETYGLGEATIPPLYGSHSPAPGFEDEEFTDEDGFAGDGSEEEDGFAEDLAAAAAPPAAVSPGAGRAAAGRAAAEKADAGGPAKPKLRDWLEARCRKEAQMYALGAAVLFPMGAAAVGLTWFLFTLLAPGGWLVGGALAAGIVAGLFWLNAATRESPVARVPVDPGGRDVRPITLLVPRGSGLTWLMYLTGSRDQPGVVRFLLGILLFGPRLCALAVQMGRTAKWLWTTDVGPLADPLKTLVRAEGKVSFAAFLEKHAAGPGGPKDGGKLPAQTLIRRLGRIDGVLFLPTSTPPGLCTSNALKEEFAAWRERWRDRRAGAGDDRLYD